MIKHTEKPTAADMTDHFEILEDNLRECCMRQSLAGEQALFHIREYAEEIAAVCEDAQEIAALLGERGKYLEEIPLDFPVASRHLLSFDRTETRFYLRMILFREIGLLMLKKNPMFFTDRYALTEPVSASAAGRISYQQNHYSDSAYLLFSGSDRVKNARASYRSHFTEVCEDVYNGVTEFGILPAGNSSEGKLLRFVALIERYELKIVAAASVPSEGGTTNEFVLVAKTADLFPPRLNGGEYLQFSVVPDHRETLREFLSAAEFCSLYPERVDTLPARDGASVAYYPVFRADNADLFTFYTYLSVDLPQAVPIGLYQNVSEKRTRNTDFQ